MTPNQRVPVGRPGPGDLPDRVRIALDPRISFWAGGSVAMGGAPWRVVKLADSARPFLDDLRSAGPLGCVSTSNLERAVARHLLDRGLAHPVIEPMPRTLSVTVLIPAYDRVEQLEACLTSLSGEDVVVIDDASLGAEEVRRVVESHGARLLRHACNRGPAAARNTGLAATTSPFVAFVDSDCLPEKGWLDQLLPHFTDPLLAAVAPRVKPTVGMSSLLARHEAARSALDMGTNPEQVRPGGRLGFVPSATMVVRRAALDGAGFDEALRLGEDVDLVWRLVDGGWQVRYEPGVTVRHEARLDPLAWLRRRFEYGTSAAALHSRHPGRLAPAHVSAWNLASLSLLVCRRSAGPAAAPSRWRPGDGGSHCGQGAGVGRRGGGSRLAPGVVATGNPRARACATVAALSGRGVLHARPHRLRMVRAPTRCGSGPVRRAAADRGRRLRQRSNRQRGARAERGPTHA
jgi:mycofactocin system glycosyltransferase